MVMLSFDSAYVLNGKNNYQEFRDTCVGQLIYRDFQNVVSNPTIWNAFLKWSTLSSAWAVQAVCGGTAPYVVIEQKHDGSTYGCFRPSEPYNIRLNRTDVQTAKWEDNESTRRKLLKELEMTILHELVHWGRHWSGAPSLKYSNYTGKWAPLPPGSIGSKDDGHMFEMEAYPQHQ